MRLRKRPALLGVFRYVAVIGCDEIIFSVHSRCADDLVVKVVKGRKDFAVIVRGQAIQNCLFAVRGEHRFPVGYEVGGGNFRINRGLVNARFGVVDGDAVVAIVRNQ